MKKIIAVSFCFFVALIMVEGQTDSLIVSNFFRAEKLFCDKEYAEALPLYLALARSNPANINFDYKIGVCLLHDLKYEQIRQSISYFELAVQQIDTFAYRNFLYEEQKSPPESWIYLSKAYKLNFEYDKAINAFLNYQKLVRSTKDPNILILNREIQDLVNSREKNNSPLDYSFANLEEILDYSSEIDNYPVLSKNGKVLVYTMGNKRNKLKDEKKESSVDDIENIYFSKKKANIWSYPINISQQLNYETRTIPVSLSPDGKDLYLVKDDNNDENIYVSHFDGKKWSEIIKLNNNINTKKMETHACIANNGNTLYFTSDREGGFGGLDIYRSDKNAAGDWGPAVNLGPKINTKYKEEVPFFFDEDDQLFFCSQGHFSIGGFDLFSNKLYGKDSCSIPFNFGEPVNSVFDDYFYVLKVDSQYIFFPIYLNIISNKENNCILVNKSGKMVYHPQNDYLVKGIILPEDSSVKSFTEIKISLIDSATADTVSNLTFSKIPAEYYFDVIPGSYKLICNGEECVRQVKQISFPASFTKSEIKLDFKLKRSIINSSTQSIANEKKPVQHIISDVKVTGDTKENVPGKEKAAADNNFTEKKEIRRNDNDVAKDNKSELVKIEDNKFLTLSDKFAVNNIYFDIGSSKLNNNSIFELNRIVNLMRTYLDLVIVISGYIDVNETDKSLSEKRAYAVYNYLLSHTISKDRMIMNLNLGQVELAKNNPKVPEKQDKLLPNCKVCFAFKNIAQKLIITGGDGQSVKFE